eukprot:m.231780 g.231780  ORF g.231780 m.231780 type:complete len:741 (+) comp15226_c0_seq1:187-2409(+)
MKPQSRQLLQVGLVYLLVHMGMATKQIPQFRPRLNAASIPAVDEASKFKKQYEALSPKAKATADSVLEKVRIPQKDIPFIRADQDGRIFYVDDKKSETGTDVPDRKRRAVASIVPESYLSNGLPIFHSKKGAPSTIYLDFDGHTTSSSNAWGAFSARAYDPSGNGASFSSYEASQIGQIWKRVAEDYLPFNVDVTTKEPSPMGVKDIHVVITNHVQTNGQYMPSYDAGGVAYLGIYNEIGNSYYKPALVFYTQLSEREDYIAEAASHEAGHNFGLSHDGNNQYSYYNGDADGTDDSWAPIMGVGYDAGVSQWSKGEYANADNLENDIQILSSQLSYRSDDHGNTRSSASSLSFNGNNQFSSSGIIERATDVDAFKITVSGAGVLTVAVETLEMPSHTAGHNLDVKLEITTSSGSTLKTVSPSSNLDASTSVSLSSSGTYYLLVSGTSHGSNKYSDYGSLGHFDITGSFQASSSPPPPSPPPPSPSPPPPSPPPPSPSPPPPPPSGGCMGDKFEPNDQYYSPATINPGTYSLTQCGDDDFYAYIPSCEDQTITVTFDSADMDLDLYVYDRNWNLVAKSNGFTGTESVAFSVSNNNKIYIYVKAYSGVGSYKLKVSESCTETTTPIIDTTTTLSSANVVSGSNYRKFTIRSYVSCTNLFQFCLTSTSSTKKGLTMKLTGPAVIVGKRRQPLAMGSARVRSFRTSCITKSRAVSPGESYVLTISGKGAWDLEYSTLDLSVRCV